MKEIYKNLFIGNQDDYEYKIKGKDNLAVIHACKEPYHRNLLGYTGRGAPQDHPEYLFAERPNRLYLNLVDAPDPKYISDIIIDKAINFINEHINAKQVLVHCNLGMSRSSTIGLLYLASIGFFGDDDFYTAEEKYSKIYPPYSPGRGMRGFAEENWGKYTNR
jgi:predicted protein tyrosine phosphatase